MSIGPRFLPTLQKLIRDDAGPQNDTQRVEQIAWLLFLKVYDYREYGYEIMEPRPGIEPYVTPIPEPMRWRNWARDKKLTGDRLIQFVNEMFEELGKLSIDLKEVGRLKSHVGCVFRHLKQRMTDGGLLRQAVNLIDKIDLQNDEEREEFIAVYDKFLQDLQTLDIDNVLNTADGGLGWGYTPEAIAEFIVSCIYPGHKDPMTNLTAGVGAFMVPFARRRATIVVRGKTKKLKPRGVYGAEPNPILWTLAIINMLVRRYGSGNIFYGNPLRIKDCPKDRFERVIIKAPFEGDVPDDVKEHFPEALRDGSLTDLYVALLIYRMEDGGRAAIIVPDEFLTGTDKVKQILKRTLLKKDRVRAVVRLPGSVFAPYTQAPANILFIDAPKEGKKSDTVWFYRVDLPEGYKAFSMKKPILPEHLEKCRSWCARPKWVEGPDGKPVAMRVKVADIAERDYSMDFCGF